jgi:hypothetical protein
MNRLRGMGFCLSSPRKSVIPNADVGTGKRFTTAKLVIQWHLRSARLDPGPALRAVRDDIKRRKCRPG